MTASHFSVVITEEAAELGGKSKKTPVLSAEDQETKQVEDRRKEFRKKENRSERERERERTQGWTKL